MPVKQRVIAGLLACVVAITVAACGDDGPSETPGVTETTEPVGS